MDAPVMTYTTLLGRTQRLHFELPADSGSRVHNLVNLTCQAGSYIEAVPTFAKA